MKLSEELRKTSIELIEDYDINFKLISRLAIIEARLLLMEQELEEIGEVNKIKFKKAPRSKIR